MLNLSDNGVVRYLGERPKANFDKAELDNEWYRFMTGEDFDPPEGETSLAMQHLEGHLKQKEEKYHLLDEEYRPNFDAHLFKTGINAMKFMKNVQTEQAATALASQMIMEKEARGVPTVNPMQPQNPMNGQPPVNPMMQGE
jgi:hypothetical protein